jgi:hypothetical protein
VVEGETEAEGSIALVTTEGPGEAEGSAEAPTPST